MTVDLLAYASITSSGRNLRSLAYHGWRLLLSPTTLRANKSAKIDGFSYALDNGAWSYFQSQQPFDGPAFRELVKERGPGADWIAVPDIVCGGLESLAFSRTWLDEMRGIDCPLLIPVQDGMTPSNLEDLVGPDIGLFIGGSAEWKENTMFAWGDMARRKGAWLHVARVNSQRRIHLCAMAGARSFDGTNATRYSVKIPGLTGATRQVPLFVGDVEMAYKEKKMPRLDGIRRRVETPDDEK